MKKLLSAGLSFLFLLVFITASQALTVNYDNSGTVWQTDALTGYATTGGMMAGMTVTVTYLDGSTATDFWYSTSSDSGQADGPDWTLSQTYDTFSYLWTLSDSSYAINSVFIDAGTGGTVFDTVANTYGTDGSALGKPFTLTGSSVNYAGTLDVTYSGLVALTGDDPVGDLYRYMNIDFGGDGLLASSLNFLADTDNLAVFDDITPVDPVPEPATMILLGTGLLGMVGFRKKKN